MTRYFPKCPVCGSSDGWNVSGTFKDFVQCKSCEAKWASTNFIICKEPKELQLWGLQKIVGGQHLVQKASDNILEELRYRAIDGKRGKMVEREHLLFFRRNY